MDLQCLFVLLLTLLKCSRAQFLIQHEDNGLNALQLITTHGYPLEIHDVITEDGYILQMHRIPHGLHNVNQTNKEVVLVGHVLSGGSADFVNHGNRSLAFILADQGYDVWLANCRGNTWSRRHTTLDNSPSSYEYWDFTYHEMGVYDLPAKIDYILKETGKPDLFYIGWSQGTTAFFIMASERPEYVSKIRMMSALAPAVYMTHCLSPAVRILSTMQKELEYTRTIGFNDFFASAPILFLLTRLLCGNVLTVGVCESFLFMVAGYNPAELEEYMVSVITTNVPTGTPTKEVIHYLQWVQSGQFKKYDYGPVRNIQKYGSAAAPNYNLQNMTIPIALYYGANDWLVAAQDVERFSEDVPNLVEKYLVPDDKFNHFDFGWSKDVVPLLYDRLLKVMKAHSK